MTVDVRTLGFKCQELRRVTLVVAKDPESAEKSWESPQAEHDTRTSCVSDDEVGTLVITPSSTSGAVMVLASYTDQRCVAPDYKGCIVARRRFSFIENVRLHLPITLEASCKDVPCNALSSCRSGVCVSSETDCASDGTCSTDAEPVVAADGGTVPPPADATLDIPPNDHYVPPGQDGTIPDPDGGDDAPVDSPSGDGADANLGPLGNACPSSDPGAPNCNALGQVCCREPSGVFQCTDSGCSGATFTCTGRAGCGQPNEYCCAMSTMNTDAGVVTYCSTDPTCGTDVTLCNSDVDCTPPTTCTGPPYASNFANQHMQTCMKVTSGDN